jgi:hypothetical protein
VTEKVKLAEGYNSELSHFMSRVEVLPDPHPASCVWVWSVQRKLNSVTRKCYFITGRSQLKYAQGLVWKLLITAAESDIRSKL